MDKLRELIDPAYAAFFEKETRRGLQKIEAQAAIDHENKMQKKASALQNNVNAADDSEAELVEVAGELIKTNEVATDMDGHYEYLENINGGPLKFEVIMQTDLVMEDRSNSGFDLYEAGAVADQETFVDAQWRRETRPKKMRPRSSDEAERRQSISKKLDRRVLDGASFDTSSHHTIDYLLDNRSAKSFTFGKDGRFPHLKKQRPVKRSLSAGNFNWNLMVDRVNQQLQREQRKYD